MLGDRREFCALQFAGGFPPRKSSQISHTSDRSNVKLGEHGELSAR